MNDYTLQTIKVGDSAQFKRVITQEMMTLFLQLSGDNNPLHVDSEFAKQHGFESCVCYGGITMSFFSTLAGVYIPGKHCLLHSLKSVYKKPVFVGDELTVSGEVSEVNTVYGEITVKVRITNQHGEVVTRGTIKAGIMDRL